MTLGSALIKAIKEVEKVYNKNVDIKKAYLMDSYGFKNRIESANVCVEVSTDNPLERNAQMYYEIMVHVSNESVKLDTPKEI